MPYTRPYAGGFVDYPSTTTPIDATALNTMDVGIKTSNDQFQTVTTTQRTALSPTVGQAVWDSDLRQLMVFMNAAGGNAWQPVGNTIVCASTTRPSVPFEGQEIYETDTNRSWTYNGAAFVPNDNVFTDEAARDAAITSPTEGMHAYLTASTVAAATGGTTAVPTGVQTIYNGAAWVCVTEVGSFTSNPGNTTSTSFTATLSGSPGTNPSVTLTTGTTVLLHAGGLLYNSGSGIMYIGVAVSGATTAAADDNFGTSYALSSGVTTSRAMIVTGLTAGSNTFTLNYRTTTGTLNTEDRFIIAKGIA
jgi:hypothetical protein